MDKPKEILELEKKWGMKIDSKSYKYENGVLTAITLSKNRIYDIVPLFGLSKLETLDLSYNRIYYFAPLLALSSLKSLVLRYNLITDITQLSALTSLTYLDLSKNQITDLSPLNLLTSLTYLDISENRITDLSPLRTLITSRKLQKLKLSGCPIVFPPKEVAEQGLDAIVSFFYDIEKFGEFKLYESKLLIVGEPGAGKTSIRKKLIDENFEIGEKAENETIGVHIYNGWTFDISDIKFTANIWDFGGQERQYPLHQYFLDDKSVYVLLSDDRADNYHLDKWFTMIRLIGGEKAKIILVLNQKERTSKSSNFSRKKYEDKGFDFVLFTLDLSKDQEEFLTIRKHIQETLFKLDHVGQSLPKNICEPIRNAFNALKISDDYIPYERFEKICEEQNIHDQKDQEKALSYLATVGDVIHYKNDPVLKNLIILNPLWLIDAIYAVITCAEIDEYHKKGRFDLTWLAAFLSKSTDTRTKVYKESESTHILNLMLKNNLDICYKYNDTDYLIPLCMPENIIDEPVFNDEYNLTWLFKYEIMPSGILAKSIVRLSDYILDNNVSKNAVLLRKDNTKALLEEYYVDGDANKYIKIFVSGTKYECLDFLNEIKGVLKSIHKDWFKFIVYEEYIPCICSICKNKKEAELHSIDEISKRINNNKKDINCKKLGDDVSIAELIGHVSKKNSEKIRELRIMLEDMQKYLYLNGEFNLLFGEALIEIQGNIFDIEEIVRKKPNSKLQALFEKGKTYKDWVAILGIPADAMTKGEKTYHLLAELFK